MLLCYSRQKFVLFCYAPFTFDSAAMAHEFSFNFFKDICQLIQLKGKSYRIQNRKTIFGNETN
jgi:hypothetical protein